MGKWLLGVAALCVAALLAIGLGGPLLVRRALQRVSQRVGQPLQSRDIEMGWGRVAMRDVRVGDRGTIRRIEIRYRWLPLLRLRVEADVSVTGVDLEIRPPDQEALREKSAAATETGSRRSWVLRSISLSESTFRYADPQQGFIVRAGVQATWRSGEELAATLGPFSLESNLGPKATAERIDITRVPGASLPRMQIHGGRLQVWHQLALTNITGSATPHADGKIDLAFAGGYGETAGRLWDASGWYHHGSGDAELRVRAQKFQLARLAPLFAKLAMADVTDAQIDGDLVLRWQRKTDAVTFQGSLGIAGLTVADPALATGAMVGLGGAATIRGHANPVAGTVTLEEAKVRFGALTFTLQGAVQNLRTAPLVDVHFRVPPIACQAALDSIPQPLISNLIGFRLDGVFQTDLHARIDFAAIEQLRADGSWRQDRKKLLEPVQLDGRVGIAGCRVLEAPPEYDARRLMSAFEHVVEITPGHMAAFALGMENPLFEPLTSISPYVVAAVLTTEDGRFFEHHGFNTREFRSALTRDLIEKRFAYGASSITMQMVKNVLLTREKTISRKLQELFLSWYVETVLPKERILEIYLNAIEFGPGIYGIGRAARHYFGKAAHDLMPLEAAFFSSILPSPKRRYEHYCRGKLSPRWEKYLQRIVRRMWERGRLTDAEYQEAQAQPLVFDRAEAKPERECLALVAKLVGATTEEPLEELELPFLEMPPGPAPLEPLPPPPTAP